LDDTDISEVVVDMESGMKLSDGDNFSGSLEGFKRESFTALQRSSTSACNFSLSAWGGRVADSDDVGAVVEAEVLEEAGALSSPAKERITVA
jgi:hypothetical protein